MTRLRLPWKKKSPVDSLEEEEAIPYQWPKPIWKRILFFPKDLVLIHLDVVHAAWYWLKKSVRKEPNCYFCSDPANFGHDTRRCSPATR